VDRNHINLADAAGRLSPWGTVYSQVHRWQKSGLWEKIHNAFQRKIRVAERRKPLPSVGIIDIHSVTTTEAGWPRGYDAGKKDAGRKWHLLVVTLGLMPAIFVTPASMQDYYGGGSWSSTRSEGSSLQ